MRNPTILSSVSVRLGALGLVILALAYWFGARPELQQLATTATQRDHLQTVILQNSDKKRLLSEARDEYSSLKQDIDRLQGVIPEASDTGSFVSSLETIANQSGVTISNLTTQLQSKAVTQAGASANSSPAKTVEQELLKSFYGTSVNLQLTGGYQNIRTFIQNIRHQERFVSISALTLNAGSDSNVKSGSLTASLNLTIFHRQPAKQ